MKFTVGAQALIEAVSTVSRVNTKSVTNPIYEQIFLKVENHTLILRATNLEVIIEKNIPIKADINGSIIIKSYLFLKIISNISKNSESISLEKNGNILTIQVGENISEIEILEEDSFPSLPLPINTITTINSKVFLDLLRSVSFCAATSDIKPEIASVYVYTKENQLIAVATDSYRLAEKKISTDNQNNINNQENIEVIIPIKNVISIISVFDTSESDLVIENYLDGIIISNQDTFLATRIINGNFPDYKQLFPKDFTTILEVKKDTLLQSLQLTTYIAVNYSFSLFTLDLLKSKISISSKEKSIGSVKTFLDMDIKTNTENADIIEVNYNSIYFLEGLQKIDSKNIVINFTTPQKPMFIQSDSDNSFTYLLMPLNR